MTRIEPSIRLPAAPIDVAVCSSSGRWNAALRMALPRAIAKWPPHVFRLREAEDFRELDAALLNEPHTVVGVEVGEENFRSLLAWRRDRRSIEPFVGLLSTPPEPWEEYAAQQHRERCLTLASIVRETGAVWTLGSPLEAMDLLEIAVRYGQTSTSRPVAAHALDTAIWRSLPWQSNRVPLRLGVRGQRPEVSR